MMLAVIYNLHTVKNRPRCWKIGPIWFGHNNTIGPLTSFLENKVPQKKKKKKKAPDVYEEGRRSKVCSSFWPVIVQQVATITDNNMSLNIIYRIV